MPITPEFSIRQDDEFLYFRINCPLSRAKDLELEITDKNFTFHADPYLLVLNLNHSIIDDEECEAKYNVEDGVFEATVKKKNAGEDFPEIYLFTTLKDLPSDHVNKIELVERTGVLEWIDEEPDLSKYGFNFWASDFFIKLREIVPYVTDLPDPENTSLPFRRKLRIKKENEDFDPDKVLNDLIFPFETNQSEANVLYKDYTPQEAKKMVEIKRREFLMNVDFARLSFFSIIEVVYSSMMDIICFGADGSCESNWTIAKLSATLSWFDLPESPEDLILTTVRRTVCYCAYRSYEISKLCWDETIKVLKETKNGRIPIIKALLRAIIAFEKAEHRWRLNKLYIEPMICWVQEIQEDDYRKWLAELFKAYENFVPKENVSYDWCLDLLEKYAQKLKKEGVELNTQDVHSDIDDAHKYALDSE